MLGNKKIRNPFPKIGLVFKYEFLSGTRTFVPVYLATIVLCMISGIFFADTFNKFSSNAFQAILGFCCFAMSFAAFVITIIFIEKRFKKGILENEAYLNLSLPVTMTEHILGRLLAYFVWGCIYILVAVISILFIASSEWRAIFNAAEWAETKASFYQVAGMGLGSFMLLVAFYVITIILFVVMFIFLINALGSLVKKGRLVVEILSVILFFVILGKVLGVAFNDLQVADEFNGVIAALWRLIAINISVVVLSVIGTISILKFRMNLEA